MFDLERYALYLDAREGATPQELAQDYHLPIEVIDERLAAAQLCFGKQVDHIEFLTGT